MDFSLHSVVHWEVKKLTDQLIINRPCDKDEKYVRGTGEDWTNQIRRSV